MQLFDGKFHANLLEARISDSLASLASGASKASLGIVQIGDNASSNKYIQLKQKLCTKFGLQCFLLKLSDSESDVAIFKKVKAFIARTDVNGVIVQLPLPRKSLEVILDLIPASKDIDALSSKSLDQKSPVVRGVEYFFNTNSITMHNLSVGILGYGVLVGQPLARFLLSYGAKVIILDKTSNFIYKQGTKLIYDVLILSVGVPNMVCGADIKLGCHVIDFGSSIINEKVVGDLDMTSSLDHLGILCPSPGGIGPLIVRFLIMNLLRL